MAYFHDLVNDALFMRVCIAIFSLLVSSLFSLMLLLSGFPRGFWDFLFFLFLLAIVLGGIYVFFVCIFGSEAKIVKLIDNFDLSSADIVGLLFIGLIFSIVGIAAIPITMIIRFFMPRSIALEFLKSERTKNNE